MTDQIEVYRDEADEWRWTRKAPNGPVVGASTEGYGDRVDALKNLARSFSTDVRISMDGQELGLRMTAGMAEVVVPGDSVTSEHDEAHGRDESTVEDEVA